MQNIDLNKQHLPTRKKLLVETLEKRILYSADAGAVLADIQNGPVEAEVRVIENSTIEKEQSAYQQTETQQRHEIIFVDESVEGYEALINDLLNNGDNRTFEIYTINGDEGIDQITNILAGIDDIDAIHIISHGEAGQIQIGDTNINNNSFQQLSTQLSQWSNALDNEADILFYGCNVAATEDGQQLLAKIADVTGADIAASTDLTGNLDKGGDWVLEYHYGQLETTTITDVNLQGTLALTPQGGETLVNQTTVGIQRNTEFSGGNQVATDANGNYVIIWESADSSGYGIYAQRFNADGVAQGSEFLVNTYEIGNQERAAVAMDDNGNFVVTWQSSFQDGSGYSIHAQRYDAAGVAQGTEFQVNSYTTNNQDSPAIAMDANGNFVITWESFAQDGSSYGIYAQRYDATGVAQGTEFQVNTYASDIQSQPDIAMDASGNFVITWESLAQDGSSYGIYAQRYNAAGVAQGTEFQVNTHVSDEQSYPSIAMNASGDFIIVWESYFQDDGSSAGVYAQRYNAAGVAQGSEFQVNTTTIYNQYAASVAMDDYGRFIVSWSSFFQDGSSFGIYAQAYNADGTTDGSEFQVSTSTTNDQTASSVAWSSSGNIIFTWSGNGTQTGNVDTYGVFFQRYSAPKPPVVTTTVANANYLENATLVIDPSITITDADSTNLTSATIAISGNYVNGEDALAFTDQLGITGSWNATTGVLTLTGNSSVANYQTAVRSITYTNSSNSPNTSTRTISFTANDGSVNSITATRNITVTQVNDPGTFGGNLSATTNEDTATSGTVTFTDTADGYTGNTFALNTAASNGTATIDAAGNWTYTPNANFNGSDSFIVQVTDDDGNVETETVSITVTQVNDAGTFGGNTSATTNEDTATSGTVTFTDTADGFTTPNFSINTAATNGTATIDAAGNWTYTPNANFNGADAFTVQVTDDDGNVETQVISITITPVADLTAANDSATIAEDTLLSSNVSANDSTTSGGTLTYAVASGVSNGTLNFNADGTYTYQGNSNFNGTDSFTYTVTDATAGESATQTVTLTVTQVNDAGTFGGNLSATTNEDTATSGTVTFTDTADGFTTPNFSINTAATNGTATIDAAGNWTYTPNANFNGSDAFTVQVTDDDGNVETQVITITVNAVNDAPTVTAPASAYSFTEQGSLNIHGTGFSFSDIDDNGGTFTATFTVGEGRILINAGDSGVSVTRGNFFTSGNSTDTVTFTGTKAQLNALLTGTSSGTIIYYHDQTALSDVPSASTTITLTINDQGNTGTDPGISGDASSEQHAASQTINISAINDTPYLLGPNLITNGTFNTDLSGWTTTGTVQQGFGKASFGVSNNTGIHSLSQTISTTIGETYVLEFDYGDNHATLNQQLMLTIDGSSNLLTDDQIVSDVDGTGNIRYRYTFTANSTSTTITFTDISDDGGAVSARSLGVDSSIDNVTVQQNSGQMGTVTFIEDAAPVVLDNDITIYDVEIDGGIDTFENTTLTLVRNGGTNSEDIFSATGLLGTLTEGGNLTYNGVTVGTVTTNSGGTLLLTFNAVASNNDVNNVMQSIAYSNSNHTPPNSVQIDWTFNDANDGSQGSGGALTTIASTTVNITAVNDPGTFGGNLSATTNEDTATSGTVTFTDTADGYTGNTFALNTAASNGTATIDAAGNWTYTPNANFNGSDSFIVQVTDDDGNVETETVSITVTQVNDAGTFGGNTSATTNEDTATSGTVTFTDTADGFTTPNFSINTAATNGTATIDAAGNWTYTPNANFNGSDAFTVQVTDDDGNVETQVISITVSAVADLTAADDSATIAEDTLLSSNVSANDSTTSGGTLTYAVASGVSNGTLNFNADGSYTYQGNSNFNGTDSFTYTVTDATAGESATQTVTLTVTQVNDAGTFGGNLSATTNEDTATSGTVTFTDTADGYTGNTFALNTAASNGTATIDAAGNWTYTPNANFNGADAFTVQVTDDDGNVETQVISITVSAVADLTAADDSATIAEDTLLSSNVSANDSTTSGGTLTYAVASGVSNGTLNFNADGSYTYQGNSNFNGTDSFTYTVTDATAGESATQTVTLTVTQVNDAGTFGGNLSATTNEDTATSGTVTFTDTADGFTTPNFSINTAATNGTATIDAAGNWTYTPNANFNGSDAFTVQVTDDDGNVETQVISITVTPVADLTAANDSATIAEDTLLSSNVSANDSTTSGGSLTYAVASGVSNGTLNFNADGTYTYQGNSNFNGTDSFTYTVTDATAGESATQTVTLTVTQVNDAGTFGGNLSATTNEDTATSGTVTFTDTADGFTTPNFSINTAATNGTATIDAAGNWTYTPNANFNGSDAFTVQVTDDDGNVETQVISITITPVADLTAANDSATIAEDTLLSSNVSANDSTTSGGTLTYAVASGVSNGTLNFNADGSYTYQGNSNFNGTDSFTYTVTDATAGESATQTVTLTVTQVNDAGTFGGNLSATTNEDTATSGTVTFTDTADGFTTPNFSINTAATNGTATIDAAGNWTYTPNANFNGSDAFTVQVTDDDGNVETQVISITITPVADLTAANDSATIAEDTLLSSNVSANDSTTSGGTLTYAVASGVSNGTLNFNADGSYTYQGNSNFNGTDSFTYTVTDATAGESATQTVTLTVTQVNDAGTFGGNLSATTNEDTATSGTVTFTDTADGFTTPNFSINTAATNGTATIDAAGNWTYTPSANFNGSDAFTVQVTDDDGNVETQVISITITPVADLTAANDSATIAEDTLLSSNVSANDSTTSGGTLTYAVASGVSNGTLNFNADGSYTYQGNSNFNGTDSFTYTVTDATAGESATQTVTLTVTQVNDAGTFGGNLSATTNEDTATSGTVTFTDTADGFTTPNFSINTAATNGTATIDAAGNWTYTPNANFNGSDAFTVQVTDDDGNVETQVISITVTPVADLTAANDSATIAEDTLLSSNVSANDSTTSGGSLTYAVASGVSNGTLNFNADGTYTYQGNSNFNGTDSFTYTVTDATAGESATQTVTLTVTQVNDAGTFGGNLSATTNEDTATSGTVTFTDTADGFTTPNFSINTAATNGTATIDAAGNWTYTPNANFNGSDAFTVQVTDDDGNVETQVISITVSAVADLTAADDSATIAEDTLLSSNVSANDSTTSGGTLTYAVASGVSNGTLNFNADGSYTYQGNSNFNGTDSFTYTVTDATAGESATQTVTLTVTQVNDAGTFGGNLSATTNEDTATSGTVTFTDTADGFTTPNFSINTAATNGTATIDAAGNWTYTPNANFNGSDAFTVQVTDDDGNVETQVISITVSAVADLTAADDSATIAEDTLLSSNVSANDSTTSGGTLTYAVASGVSNGTLNFNADGSYTYQGNSNFNGTDSFTYTVTDATAGESATQTVTLTVTQVNDAGTLRW